jgi:hypothetical protein
MGGSGQAKMDKKLTAENAKGAEIKYFSAPFAFSVVKNAF